MILDRDASWRHASSFREHTHYANEMAEMALARAVSDKMKVAYPRGELLAKRQVLALDWQGLCLGTVQRMCSDPESNLEPID